MIAAVLRTLSLAATRCLAGARATWHGGGEPPCRQRIYCVNHTSHLDAVLLLASLPKPLERVARPVAAAEYWNHGRVRRYWARKVFRTVLIERDRRQMNPLEPAFDALRQGDSLIFFPEGTRGLGGSLQPFKPGLFCLARAFPQVEIVPVWIDNAHRILPKGSSVPLPGSCGVSFGVPLRWEGEQETAALLSRVRTGMEAARQQAAGRLAHVGQRPAVRRYSVNDV